MSASQQTLLGATGSHVQEKRPDGRLTVRAVVLGSLLGTMVCIVNTYYGLQTGFAIAMTQTTSLLGFSILKAWEQRGGRATSAAETVLIQTTATAVGLFPATAGLLGVIPALEYFVPKADLVGISITTAGLLIWSLGLANFGLIWAMILRRPYIEKQNLPWPGAKATAVLIQVLHKETQNIEPRASGSDNSHRRSRRTTDPILEGVDTVEPSNSDLTSTDWQRNVRLLTTFGFGSFIWVC